MDLLTSLRISASGLAAQKKRMEAHSSNIANAQTTRTAEGGPYRRKEVVFGSEPFPAGFTGAFTTNSVPRTPMVAVFVRTVNLPLFVVIFSFTDARTLP